MSKSVSLPFIPHTVKNKHTISIPNLNSNSLHLSPTPIPKNTIYNFYLKPSREVDKRGSIEFYSGSVGPKAKLDFALTYKNRLKITDRNSYEKLESSPSAAYLEVVDKKHLRPMAFGIVRNSGKETEFNVQGLSMGDNYALAISEGIKRCKSIEKVNLKDNRLSEKGLTSILGKLEINKIKYLCLSDNVISIKVIKQISEILIDPKCNIRHLVLESTKINDQSAFEIFEAMALNNSVSRLNLARNSLTESSCKTLRSMLSLNHNLKKLDLHWNQLKGSGILQIFEGLEKNLKLRELDLSWNLMNRNLDEQTTRRISEIIRNLPKLRHLDLSSNYLGSNSCEILAKGLEDNHSILGIHMLGNDCRVDARGFLHPDNYVSKVEQGHIKNRIFAEKKSKHLSVNNCWLCEDWVEMEFEWTGEASEPVCIHLECDDFQPGLMVMNEKGTYSVTRVVPCGKVRFFFSVNLVIIKSKDFKIAKLPLPIEKEIVFWNSVKVTIFITNVNQLETNGKAYNIRDLFKIVPRMPKLTFKPPKSDLEKIPWSINISIFKRYRLDDLETLTDCFDFDWKHSRIPNIMKKEKEIEEVKSTLLSFYPVIREAYKTLAAYSGSEIPCIGTNVMTDLLSSCKVFDQFYAINDFGVNWNTVLVQTVKNQLYNPGNALVRYEFLEILVRIAFDKYLRSKLSPNLSEAIKSLFSEHLLEKFETLNSSKWRRQFYRVELTDVTLKAHKAIFEAIFKKFSGRKCLPGQKPFMSLEEFRDVCVGAGLINDLFSTREIDVCYFQSMMTQVDELFSKRHTKMHYVEFLEAITRAYEITSLSKPNYDLAESKPSNTSLKEKIENACHSLLNICPQSLQDSFVFPNEKTYEKLMFKPKGSLLRSTTLNLLDVSY